MENFTTVKGRIRKVVFIDLDISDYRSIMVSVEGYNKISFTIDDDDERFDYYRGILKENNLINFTGTFEFYDSGILASRILPSANPPETGMLLDNEIFFSGCIASIKDLTTIRDKKEMAHVQLDTLENTSLAFFPQLAELLYNSYKVGDTISILSTHQGSGVGEGWADFIISDAALILETC